MRPSRSLPTLALLTLVAALLLLGGGCFKRPSKQPVYREGGIEISLRSQKVWTQTVEKGFDHPLTIAPVRVAHILSRLDLHPSRRGGLIALGEGEKRVAAVPTEHLFSIAEGVSQALAAADPNQEVVVMAVNETKRLGIFDHDFLTSFVVYARDERLHLHFSRHEWEIPKRRDDRLPEPRVGDHPQHFKLLASTAVTLLGDQSVAVDWRDPVFAKPTRTEVRPDGGVVRRTILMESPAEVVDDVAADTLPGDLSPQQLRDLADLEEARREGRVPENEYRSRRREILSP